MERAEPRGNLTAESRATEPSEEDVRAQLTRIEASGEFKVSDRVRAFLHYVVEEALAGRSNRIKAYSIATEVFGRGADFDSANDPVVRIEAGRLRKALERYYFVAGRTDPLLIDIPKGGYVPTFTLKQQDALPEAALSAPATMVAPPKEKPRNHPRPWLSWKIAGLAVLVAGVLVVGLSSGRTNVSLIGPDPTIEPAWPPGPSVLVRPFINLGGDADAQLYAAGMTDEVLSQLARFRELIVVGRETSISLAPIVDPSDSRTDLSVQYVLEGSVKTGENALRVNARLINNESAVVLWSHAYEADLTSGDIVGIVVDLSGQVAATIAQPYGIIFRFDERRLARDAPGDLAAYRCTLRFYQYRTVLGAAEHATVRGCLERAVAQDPAYGTAWAMLSYLYLDEERFDFNPRAGEPSALERALVAARRAVRIDPYNVRALQALMSALFFAGEPEEALRIGEQALALNPNDTELLGEFGSRVAQAGDWQRGAELLEKALALNPGNSGYYAGMLGFAAFMQQEHRRAVTLIQEADLEKFPIFHVVAALIYSKAGLAEAAAESRERFLEMRPHFFDNLQAELAIRNFGPEDRRFLTAAARDAGFPVP